jgi:hypothetical protein
MTGGDVPESMRDATSEKMLNLHVCNMVADRLRDNTILKPTLVNVTIQAGHPSRVAEWQGRGLTRGMC